MTPGRGAGGVPHPAAGAQSPDSECRLNRQHAAPGTPTAKGQFALGITCPSHLTL